MSNRSRLLLSKKLLILADNLEDLSILINRNINFIKHRRGEPLPELKASSFRIASNSSVPGVYLDRFDVVARLSRSPAPGRLTVEIVQHARRVKSIPDFIITKDKEYPMNMDNMAAKPKAARKPPCELAAKVKAVVKEYLKPGIVMCGNLKLKLAVDNLVAIKSDTPENKERVRSAIREFEKPNAFICTTPSFRKAVADLAEAVSK